MPFLRFQSRRLIKKAWSRPNNPFLVSAKIKSKLVSLVTKHSWSNELSSKSFESTRKLLSNPVVLFVAMKRFEKREIKVQLVTRARVYLESPMAKTIAFTLGICRIEKSFFMIIRQKLFESAGGSPTPVVEMHKTKSSTLSSLKSASAIGAKLVLTACFVR